MNHLHVYPTSRAVRKALQSLTPLQSLEQTHINIAEFQSKAYYVPQLIQINPNARLLFFNENIDASLFTKTQTVFKLFEELAHEHIELEQLLNVDTYAEYEEQILELIELQKKYEAYLLDKGYFDRFMVPKLFRIAHGYIQNFDSITVHIDGYLTKFEFELFEQIATIRPFFIEIEIDSFSKKNISKFKDFDLSVGYRYRIDFTNKSIVTEQKLSQTIDCEVYALSHRINQTMFVFESINRLIDSGIEPENIAVILPDERFKYLLKTYDKFTYLNFAMGFDYKHTRTYKALESIYKYLTSIEAIDIERFESLHRDLKIQNEILDAETFIATLEKIVPFDSEELQKTLFHFRQTYKSQRLKLSEFLYLLLKDLQDIRVDDVRGGKVTVIGPIESRAVSFEGVVIVDFNDGFVPKINQKDIYLNTKIKKLLDLPTYKDREELQKHLYYALLSKAKKSYICYSGDESKSKFLFELGLETKGFFEPDLSNFYPLQRIELHPPKQFAFDAKDFVWSSTMLQTYLDCTMKFYYKYIQKIQEPKEDKINEGKILHDVLARCETFLPDEIASILHSYAPDRFFKKYWQPRLEKVGEIFTKLETTLAYKEKKIRKNIDSLEFTGVVDRVDRFDNGNYLIIDYKSGKIENRVKNLERLSDFQMPIYFLLMREYEPTLAYFSLKKGTIEYVQSLDAKIQLLFEHINALKEQKVLKPRKCDDINLCRYCPYTLLCQRGEYS
jgi:CRISPR/Cas system-associated exonuclease Cas4 (RecB family)